MEHEPAWPSWMTTLGAWALHPRTIRALLGTGGGLVIAGGLVWLVSLGVFDDPRVLASSLIGGCCALLFLGWGLATRTRYRMAGLAAAGLACVTLPLNLWLLHAQHLVEITGGLWAWAAGCAALQAATVWLLKDRRFLLAVQGGVTLTALLALGQGRRLDEPLWIAGTLAVLGVLSVEGVRLFPRGKEDDGGPKASDEAAPFARDPFAVPLLWGGAALLTGAAAFAALAEVARNGVVFLPRLPLETAAPRLIAAAIWTAIANGLVSLDALAADVRRRRDRRAGVTRDEGLFGWWSVIPVLAAGAGAAAVWNMLEYLGLPDRWDAAVYAACGVGLLAAARAAGVGVIAVDRGAGAGDEARGPGATALRCGAVVLAGAELFAVSKGVGALFNGPLWADAGGLAAVAGLGLLGGSLNPVPWAKTLHRTLAAVALGLAALAANQLLNVPLGRKLEAVAVALGAAMLAGAHAGRVREHVRDGQPDEPFVTDAIRRMRDEERGVVTVGLWFGTLFVLLPTAAAVFVTKANGDAWAPDALALVAAASSLLIVGLSARTLAPALGGSLGLAGAATLIVWSVVHRAEVTLGVGLTAGGATLFVLGLILSVLRDRLSARLASLPRRFAEREGLFAVLDWR
ncbi:hypothetical protein [Alienimonas californiensis]|nr:hypothetical protein [Alienimonas californiensis]